MALPARPAAEEGTAEQLSNRLPEQQDPRWCVRVRRPLQAIRAGDDDSRAKSTAPVAGVAATGARVPFRRYCPDSLVWSTWSACFASLPATASARPTVCAPGTLDRDSS